jgi:flagellar basal body rod protein FlgG
MISGQRAYEINSRAVSAADDMLRAATGIVR